MQDWAGWLLMLLSFGIVLMWKRVRSDTKVVHAIWFCIFFHHAVAFLNAYVGTVIGAGYDAFTFHKTGVELAALPEPEWYFTKGINVYTLSLGLFYRAFGASNILGEELSVLAFVMSCVVLVKLVDLLDLKRFRVGIILLFGLLPSAVIFRSVTLRESWQALFFLLTVYWAVRLWKRPGIFKFLFMLMSAYCMAVQHNGLKVYAVYLVVISVYWGVVSRKKGTSRALRFVKFLFAGLFITCVFVLAQKNGWFVDFGQALKGAAKIREYSITLDARAVYGVMLDTSSVLGLVKTIPIVFVQYMFAPFPWQVESVADIHVMLESLLRFLLLYFALSSWRRSSGKVRSCYNFLLLVTFGMEFVWALGTINWGTATRHHVPGYSVIVLLGAPGLILFMRKLHFKMFGCRKDNIMLLK